MGRLLGFYYVYPGWFLETEYPNISKYPHEVADKNTRSDFNFPHCDSDYSDSEFSSDDDDFYTDLSGLYAPYPPNGRGVNSFQLPPRARRIAKIAKPRDRSGGVIAKVDYKFSDMAEFYALMVHKMIFKVNLKWGGVTLNHFKRFMLRFLVSTRLPRLTIMIGLVLIYRRWQRIGNIKYCPDARYVYTLSAVSLILANKWADTKSFTNETWVEATRLEISDLIEVESRWLHDLDFTLVFDEADSRLLSIWGQCWKNYKDKRMRQRRASIDDKKKRFETMRRQPQMKIRPDESRKLVIPARCDSAPPVLPSEDNAYSLFFPMIRSISENRELDDEAEDIYPDFLLSKTQGDSAVNIAPLKDHFLRHPQTGSQWAKPMPRQTPPKLAQPTHEEMLPARQFVAERMTRAASQTAFRQSFGNSPPQTSSQSFYSAFRQSPSQTSSRISTQASPLISAQEFPQKPSLQRSGPPSFPAFPVLSPHFDQKIPPPPLPWTSLQQAFTATQPIAQSAFTQTHSQAYTYSPTTQHVQARSASDPEFFRRWAGLNPPVRALNHRLSPAGVAKKKSNRTAYSAWDARPLGKPQPIEPAFPLHCERQRREPLAPIRPIEYPYIMGPSISEAALRANHVVKPPPPPMVETFVPMEYVPSREYSRTVKNEQKPKLTKGFSAFQPVQDIRPRLSELERGPRLNGDNKHKIRKTEFLKAEISKSRKSKLETLKSECSHCLHGPSKKTQSTGKC